MALLTKPNMQQIWASGGDVVEPTDLKKQQGWTVEVPPHQFENWIQKRQDEYLAHINQRGIPAWDALTEYEAGGLSYVQGSDGKIYKSVAASGPSTTTQNPTTDVSDTYWTIAFADVGAFLTQAAGDARYLQRSLNGSDIPNAVTFRTNIGVYSKVESDALDKLNTLRIDVAAAPSVALTSLAPDTRHIRLTGAATINGFVVAAGKCYFVSFNGASTLTNSSALVTQRGANIVTAAGDTCIIRATADDVVEVLSYKSWKTQKNECTAWVNFNGTGTLAVRDSYNVTSITDNGTGDYTINFTAALSSANYALVGCVNSSAATSAQVQVAIASAGSTSPATTKTTSACRILTASTTNNLLVDMNDVSISIFG